MIEEGIKNWSKNGRTIDYKIEDLSAKLEDLNRKSIVNKIKTLFSLWSISLSNISDDQINKAKSARNDIVHRGVYYEEGKKLNNPLEEHVAVMREIVVRLIFTVIGYKGLYNPYISENSPIPFPQSMVISNENCTV